MYYELEFYQRENGREPVKNFLDNLKRKNKRLFAAVYKDLMYLKEVGRELTMPDCRSMGNGLYELRSGAGSDIARIFYFFFWENKIILTNGFIKKTQKTPAGELEKAVRYKKDYEAKHDKRSSLF